MNAPAATLAPTSPERAPPGTGALGMWIFIASEILFFGGLFFAYLYGRSHWPAGFAVASRHTDVVLGTLNTGLLLTSSALVALALACAERDSWRWTARLLALTAAIGVAFIAIKIGLEYRHEFDEHLFPGAGFALAAVPGAEQFWVLYFVMTGIHAVHLAVGVGLMAAFARGAARRRPWIDAERVEVAALYWHFVDVVWIFLYPLIYLVQRY